LWIEECPISRRPYQSTRNLYRIRKKSSLETDGNDESETEDKLIELDVDKWVAWFCDDSSGNVSDME